jgi:FkbM family methyltransferase
MERTMVTTRVEFGGRAFSLSHSDESDHIFRSLQASQSFYESELLGRLAMLVRPGDLVIDAGANIGNHTVFFAGACDCRVLAFEPVPEAFRLLEKNIADNGLSELVTAYPIALGDREGRASIDLSAATHNLGGASLRAGAGEVTVRRLDDIIEGEARPALIKVDTEGFELPVLRGAERTLQASRPLLCVEAKEPEKFSGLFEYLAERHYLLGETHNYSPTHIFFPVSAAEATALTTALSRFAGAFYIRAEAEQQRVRERLLGLETRVQALEASSSAAPDRDEAGGAIAAPAPETRKTKKSDGRRERPGKKEKTKKAKKEKAGGNGGGGKTLRKPTAPLPDTFS